MTSSANEASSRRRELITLFRAAQAKNHANNFAPACRSSKDLQRDEQLADDLSVQMKEPSANPTEPGNIFNDCGAVSIFEVEAPSPQSNETELAKAKWRPEDLPSRESAKIEHLKVYDAKWTVGPTRHTDLAPAVPQSFRTNLENFGVEYLHPVQHLAYKHIFAGKSMLLSAPPSSGKTLAYLLPTLWKCTTREEEDESEGWPKRSGFCKPEGLSEVPFKDAATPRAVIVVPTRESADAVHMEARRFLMNAKAPLRICKVLGGVAMEEEVEDLATGCDLLIGTMGRLREYIDAPEILRLERCRLVVFDDSTRFFMEHPKKPTSDVGMDDDPGDALYLWRKTTAGGKRTPTVIMTGTNLGPKDVDFAVREMGVDSKKLCLLQVSAVQNAAGDCVSGKNKYQTRSLRVEKTLREVRVDDAGPKEVFEKCQSTLLEILQEWYRELDSPTSGSAHAADSDIVSKCGRVVVFCETIATVDKLYEWLKVQDLCLPAARAESSSSPSSSVGAESTPAAPKRIPIEYLHSQCGGGLGAKSSTCARRDVVRKWKQEERMVVLTSDVARSLHIEGMDINLVINFDLPYSIQEFEERCGRSGRVPNANNKGSAIQLVPVTLDGRIETDCWRTLETLRQIAKNTTDPRTVVPDAVRSALLNQAGAASDGNGDAAGAAAIATASASATSAPGSSTRYEGAQRWRSDSNSRQWRRNPRSERFQPPARDRSRNREGRQWHSTSRDAHYNSSRNYTRNDSHRSGQAWSWSAAEDRGGSSARNENNDHGNYFGDWNGWTTRRSDAARGGGGSGSSSRTNYYDSYHSDRHGQTNYSAAGDVTGSAGASSSSWTNFNNSSWNTSTSSTSRADSSWNSHEQQGANMQQNNDADMNISGNASHAGGGGGGAGGTHDDAQDRDYLDLMWKGYTVRQWNAHHASNGEQVWTEDEWKNKIFASAR